MGTTNKQLWELYPEGVREIAKQEPIYSKITLAAMASTTYTDGYYMPFVQKALSPEKYPKADEKKVELAKAILRSSTALQVTDSEGLEAALNYIELTWPAYKVKMLMKPDFAEWMFEGGIVFSFYMYMFYTEVDGFLGFDPELRERICPVQTYQMDVGFGEYHDACGRPVKFADGDLIMWHITNHALWRGVRMRAPYFNYYLREAGYKANVVDLGSGPLNMEKRFGYVDAGLCQRIVAYDSDKNIPKVLPYMFQKPIEEYGFEFHNEDWFDAFKDQALQGKQHLVVLQGGASYYFDKIDEILRGVRGLLLSPNEAEVPTRFVFEVELETVDLAQAKYGLGLKDQSQNMMPDKTVGSAVERISQAVERVGGFEVEEVISDAGFYVPLEIAPTTVIFVLKTV